MSYAQTARKRTTEAWATGKESGAQSFQTGQAGGMPDNSILQAKLMVGSAHTSAEAEADSVAQRIVGGSSPIHETDASAPVAQRETEAGEAGEGFLAGAELSGSLSRSSGRNLDGTAGERLGSRLGADFSDVKVHTDQHAQQAAAGMHARAFTVGKNIYFNKNQYNPGTAAGQELLAHELTHTIQQGAVSQRGGIPVHETASAHTVQRKLFSFFENRKVVKNFRKAVDELNGNYEDYKKQSGWERFKWVMKNPLAWIFGRMEVNQQNTRDRIARRNRIAEFAQNMDWNSDTSNEELSVVGAEERKKLLTHLGTDNHLEQLVQELNVGDEDKKKTGKEKADMALMGTTYSGMGGSIAAELLEEWADPNKGMGKTADGILDKMGCDTFRKWNSGITDHMSGEQPQYDAGMASGGLGIVSGLGGMVAATKNAWNGQAETNQLMEQGDYLGALGKQYGTIGEGAAALKNLGQTAQSVLKLAGNTEAVAGLKKYLPGMDIMTGGMKIAGGAAEIYRTSQIKNRTRNLEEEYADRAEGLEGEEKRKISRQMGLLRMGNLTARSDQTRAGFQLASGILEAGGGAAKVLGSTSLGTGLQVGGMALNLGGKLYAGSKEKKLKIVFEFAGILGAKAVIPIPDISYLKYLSTSLAPLQEDFKKQIMEKFRKETEKIADFYLEAIEELKAEYPSVELKVLHGRDPELCREFYEKREWYFRKSGLIRRMTRNREKTDAVFDYISMLALPYYFFGTPQVIQVDNLDETDSYRKCRKVHKGVFSLSSVLYPERLSTNGKDTIFHAPLEYKEYRSREQRESTE